MLADVLQHANDLGKKKGFNCTLHKQFKT